MKSIIEFTFLPLYVRGKEYTFPIIFYKKENIYDKI